jgi:hypothetical protein
MLRADTTGFLLVSSASPASADDAAWLRHDLERRKVPIDAVVFNQSYVPVHPTRPGIIETQLSGHDLDATWQRLAPHAKGHGDLRTTLGELRELRAEAAQENLRYQSVIDGLTAELPPETQRVRAPRFDDEIRDLRGLLRLVEFLVG